jgi:hypothetical protein
MSTDAWRAAATLALTALALLSPGCKQRADRLPLAHVWGKVFVDGKPVRCGVVIFAPDRERGNTGPVGRSIITNAQGVYWLGTYENQDGATVGWHRVCVHQLASPKKTSPDLLPAAFNTETQLRAYVAPNLKNVIDFHLTTKPFPSARIQRRLE